MRLEHETTSKDGKARRIGEEGRKKGSSREVVEGEKVEREKKGEERTVLVSRISLRLRI